MIDAGPFVYDGRFDLAWLRDGESVRSAGDRACLVAWDPAGALRLDPGDAFERRDGRLEKILSQPPLAVGDRIRSRPCDATVTCNDHRGVWAWCSTCVAPHAISGQMWEQGRGPWRLVQDGRADG